MNKVFLSHSSNDKKYVQYIAEQFGRDYCVYYSTYFKTKQSNKCVYSSNTISEFYPLI